MSCQSSGSVGGSNSCHQGPPAATGHGLGELPALEQEPSEISASLAKHFCHFRSKFLPWGRAVHTGLGALWALLLLLNTLWDQSAAASKVGSIEFKWGWKSAQLPRAGVCPELKCWVGRHKGLLQASSSGSQGKQWGRRVSRTHWRDSSCPLEPLGAKDVASWHTSALDLQNSWFCAHFSVVVY